MVIKKCPKCGREAKLIIIDENFEDGMRQARWKCPSCPWKSSPFLLPPAWNQYVSGGNDWKK